MFDRSDRIIGYAIGGIGLLHIGVTPLAYPDWTMRAMWFVSGGMAMVLLAALNLLRNRYVHVAPGLRWTCAAANIAFAAFCAAVIAVTPGGPARIPQGIVLMSLMLAATYFSVAEPPRLWSIRDERKPPRHLAA